MRGSHTHIWSVLANHGFHSLEPPQECAQKANNEEKKEGKIAGKRNSHRAEEFDVLSAQKIENNFISWDEPLVLHHHPKRLEQPVIHTGSNQLMQDLPQL